LHDNHKKQPASRIADSFASRVNTKSSTTMDILSRLFEASCFFHLVSGKINLLCIVYAIGIWKITIFNFKKGIQKTTSPWLSLFYTFPFCLYCINTQSIHLAAMKHFIPITGKNFCITLLGTLGDYSINFLFNLIKIYPLPLKTISISWCLTDLAFLTFMFFGIHIIFWCKFFSILSLDTISWCTLMNRKMLFTNMNKNKLKTNIFQKQVCHNMLLTHYNMVLG